VDRNAISFIVNGRKLYHSVNESMAEIKPISIAGNPKWAIGSQLEQECTRHGSETYRLSRPDNTRMRKHK